MISGIILLISVVVTVFIFMTEPVAEREGATVKTAMLVDVVQVKRGDYTPTVIATGTVQAARDIILSTQVGGEVISISDQFVPGAFARKGEVLLRINPADYKNELELRKSDLQLAKADLSIEMGRQDVARKDYELVGAELSPDNKDLVLRKPQLEAAKANVVAAQAAVDQAQLNLRRTTIRAPFDAHIISRNTNVGSQISPGTEVGRITGVHEYWAVANVPLSKVHWLRFGKDEAGSPVKVLNNSWPAGAFRRGHLFQLVGALDDETRMARVLISVDDPLARNQPDTVPKLMIGTFVENHIQARTIEDVVRLDRDHLRKGKTVWVMTDGKLQVRKVDVRFQDARYAYVSEGLSDNDKVITTDLSTVVEGADLRLEKDTAEENSNKDQETARHE